MREPLAVGGTRARVGAGVNLPYELITFMLAHSPMGDVEHEVCANCHSVGESPELRERCSNAHLPRREYHFHKRSSSWADITIPSASCASIAATPSHQSTVQLFRGCRSATDDSVESERCL